MRKGYVDSGSVRRALTPSGAKTEVRVPTVNHVGISHTESSPRNVSFTALPVASRLSARAAGPMSYASFAAACFADYDG